jgi:hypothetical protein
MVYAFAPIVRIPIAPRCCDETLRRRGLRLAEDPRLGGRVLLVRELATRT